MGIGIEGRDKGLRKRYFVGSGNGRVPLPLPSSFSIFPSWGLGARREGRDRRGKVLMA